MQCVALLLWDIQQTLRDVSITCWFALCGILYWGSDGPVLGIPCSILSSNICHPACILHYTTRSKCILISKPDVAYPQAPLSAPLLMANIPSSQGELLGQTSCSVRVLMDSNGIGVNKVHAGAAGLALVDH